MQQPHWPKAVTEIAIPDKSSKNIQFYCERYHWDYAYVIHHFDIHFMM